MSLNSRFYARLENRGIALKALADEMGGKERISDRVVKAIAERIGRDHRESFSAHNFSSPKWKTLRIRQFIILFVTECQCLSQSRLANRPEEVRTQIAGRGSIIP